MLYVNCGLLITCGRTLDALEDTRAAQEALLPKFHKYYANRASRERPENVHHNFHLNSFWDVANAIQAALCLESEILAALGEFDSASDRLLELSNFAQRIEIDRENEDKAADGGVPWKIRSAFAISLLRNKDIVFTEISPKCRAWVRKIFTEANKVRSRPVLALVAQHSAEGFPIGGGRFIGRL